MLPAVTIAPAIGMAAVGLVLLFLLLLSFIPLGILIHSHVNDIGLNYFDTSS